MTMPRGASRALYAGNGQATEFPFFFKVFEEDQLSVLITSPAGVTTEAAGWTAELDDGGGTVSYLHNGAPLPEGWKLAIMRDMPFVQEVDLITGTRFDPEVIETALDVATAERQQLLERLARAVVVEPTDEAGPEALLADIRDARSSAQSSASASLASANAAAGSAQSAAGSAAVATEAREAACICAQESQTARDVAIAQTEAANTLMEAELAKVNAIVAANKTDQQAAVTAARAWAEKEANTPVEYDEDGNPLYSARHWAENAQKIAIDPPTAERRGAIRVGAGLELSAGENGETDVLGVSPALGGNLLLNSEAWITESGTWTAPVTGWYDILLIAGGQGAAAHTNILYAGTSGEYKSGYVYLEEGEEVDVTIGAGGTSHVGTDTGPSRNGGKTAFGTCLSTGEPGVRCTLPGEIKVVGNHTGGLVASGGGFGANIGHYANTNGAHFSSQKGFWYGAGGGCSREGTIGSAGDGYQGAIRARWHDPAKAAGPLPAPALFAARRMAAPGTAAAPVTVNLYDPETGQGSVWRAEDAEAKLAEGLIAQEAWREMCAAKAAEEHAAWLADPDTEAERFALLRSARDARLAATDYLVAPDYPLSDEQRAAVISYRQALRDLPAQAGAPWDGGGELTPWPELPLLETAAEAPCA